MTECPDAAVYISFIPHHISSSVHIAICIISIVVNLMFIRVCRRDLPCHQNFRVLILALVFVNFMHTLAYIVILMTHLVKVARSKESCDVLVSGLFCYVTRLITSSCYTAHTTLLFGLLSERVVTTKFAATYEKCTSVIGYGILIATLVLAVTLCVIKQKNFHIDMKSYYCSSLTNETYDDVLFVHSALLFMLVVTVIVFGLLYVLNMKIRKRITRDVNSKYQASENLRVLRLLGPLLILHFVGYPTYFAISVVVQSLKAIFGELTFRVIYSVVYFPSHYCLLSTTILWYIIRKDKRLRENSPTVFQTSNKQQREDDIYFQNYNTMWK